MPFAASPFRLRLRAGVFPGGGAFRVLRAPVLDALYSGSTLSCGRFDHNRHGHARCPSCAISGELGTSFGTYVVAAGAMGRIRPDRVVVRADGARARSLDTDRTHAVFRAARSAGGGTRVAAQAPRFVSFWQKP